MDFKEKTAELIAKELKIPLEQALALLTTPPQGMGDYAFPCFIFAKEKKKSPVELAKEIAGKIKADFFEKVEAKGPYVNFFIAKENLSTQTLKSIFNGELFKTKLGEGKVMVEYSSPNTNKPLHVGHLRNNTLGLAIANLLESTGHNVIKANLINDRGIHICKSMLAYKLFGKERDPIKEKVKPDHFVGEMYVLFNTKLKEDPTLEEKAQSMLKAWEKGDKEIIALWKKMNKWAISGMKETYNTFGTRFDEWFLESDLFKKGDSKKIIEEGLKKKIFQKEDNGAISAILEPELPNKVLLRGDGTSLYATNDLALTQYKFDTFGLDKAIWVVANEQDLYFKQLFKIFEKLERKWAKNCHHLSYGYVSLLGGRMKSREGTVVDADDLINDVKKIALEEIQTRYPDLSKTKSEERALVIALAAIKFYLLKNDSKKDMIFEPEKSISFEGETGPYLQYTYARARSIMRKAKEEGIGVEKLPKADFALLIHEKEKELLTELSKYPQAISRAWEGLSLHPVCHLLLLISEKFNSFYHEVSVLKADNEKEKLARVALVEATTIVLKKGFELIDIEAIEEM
ncbi:MAG: arginine--tRNA ligase [Candidatus Diapherotrites archaeon]|nr:arginine--tRNA ligase [Candidatus Diapherotrites archaeon]